MKSKTNDIEKLKKSVSEWVIALDTKQYETEEKIKEIEERLSHLESLHSRTLKGDLNEF